MSDLSTEERLLDLRRRTEGVRARAGFQARVMLAVAHEAASAFPAELARSARWFVPFALALAIGALGWASGENEVTSAELARAELTWELEW